MRLRTTAGAYAGHIRDYGLSAGLAALRAGTAERLDQTADPAPAKTRTVGARVSTKKKSR